MMHYRGLLVLLVFAVFLSELLSWNPARHEESTVNAIQALRKKRSPSHR